jgi:hypothetical protein
MKDGTDRVRRHTASSVLHKIDNATAASLLEQADAPGDRITARQHALDKEWDTDRTIEAEAATLGLIGLALGALVHPRLLIVPKIVAAALLLHAVTGWYPSLPLFRRLGIRSAREIARERYALKVLRGDFDKVQGQPPGHQEQPRIERRRVPRDIA